VSVTYLRLYFTVCVCVCMSYVCVRVCVCVCVCVCSFWVVCMNRVQNHVAVLECDYQKCGISGSDRGLCAVCMCVCEFVCVCSVCVCV